MNVKYLASLVTGVLECILFSGILFGWPSLRYVLEKDGYFSHQCMEDQVNETTSAMNAVSSTMISNSTSTGNTLAYFDNARRIYLGSEDNYSTIEPTTVHSGNENVEDGEYPTCSRQAEMLNLVFTIASTLLSFSTLINGYIFDTFGTWVARVIAILLFTFGCILMVCSSLDTSSLLFPALASLAIGGILMLVTNLQIGNLFGRFRSSIITLMSGSFDSSSFVFLIFKMLYDAGASSQGIFQVVSCCTIFLWVRTFLLLPKKHIPFPITKGYDFGIANCRSQEAKSEPKEMTIVKSDANNAEEKEALTVKFDPDVEIEDKSTAVTIYLKKSLFWGNVAHFSMLQLRNYFFMGTLYEWLQPMTSSDDELSSYLNIFGICQLFGACFAPFNGLLTDTVTRVLKNNAVNNDLLPLQAVAWSAVATTLLGTIFSIVVAIPSLSLQYLSFILQVAFRSFLYGGNLSFIAVAFPGEHFGKLYGITMFVGGCVSLLQFPLFTLVIRQMGGNFLVINIVMVFISLLTLAHPYNVYRYCRNKAAEKTSSTDDL